MNFKSLLFGSAAILAAGTGAQAADLPVVEPVEYVRICDAFGTGFYYIPGTDTCLRISGRVRVEWHYVDGDDLGPEFDNWTTRARGNVRLDARTQTDFGLIRAFINFQMTVGPGNGISESGTFVDGGGTPNYDGTGADLDQAYIQISRERFTFTAGHVDSFFDAPFSSNTFGTRVGIDDPTGSQTLFGVTFSAGGPLSISVAAQDPASGGKRLNSGPFDDDYEGQELPDGVANIRWDGGWGSLFAAGLVHHIHDVNEDGIGWATNVGLVVDFGMLNFGATAGYADGAIGHITNDPGGVGDFSFPDGDQGTTAWAVRAGVGADFTPTLSAFIDASYTDVDEDDVSAAFDDDYTFWAVAANVIYSPVSGLIMGPEVAYNSLECDENAAGTNCTDADVWGVMWRIQRDF